MNSKTCTKCREAKPPSEFGVHCHGLHPQCKACRALIERSRSAEYKCWKNMNARCRNPNHPDFANYGGRGITVCEEWQGHGGYARFIAHVGLKPNPEDQLDRTDNERGYEPGNVRWVPQLVNARNRRNNRRVTWNGETKAITEWAEQLGVELSLLTSRLRRGWSGGDVLFGKSANRVG